MAASSSLSSRSVMKRGDLLRSARISGPDLLLASSIAGELMKVSRRASSASIAGGGASWDKEVEAMAAVTSSMAIVSFFC